MAVAVLVAAITFGCGERAVEPATKAEPAATTPSVPADAATDDETRTARLTAIRGGYDADPEGYGGKPGSAELVAVLAELRAITNEAQDVHLRANAALLLGAMHQERGQWAEAADAYRRASALVPDDAGPWMALARAEAKRGDRADLAIAAGEKALALDPDNLENFLVLGELFVKADRKDDATAIYAKYEVRRKGLIDGLTLTKDGNYLVSIDERIACAEALAAAADMGTAVALMYALDKDPEPRVRAAVASIMGVQRLAGYKEFLVKALAKEQDADVKQEIVAAIAEIERDPVELPRGPAPAADPSGADEGAAGTHAAAATPASTDGAPGGTPPAR
jgi:tetratricopeptide (TPR) repeat protein